MVINYTPPISRKNIVIFLLLICTVWCHSQNLVVNPSFEEFIACPDNLGIAKDNIVGWSVPTDGTTDYFNTCSVAMGVPYNFNGNQQPKNGLGYLGFYLFAANDYREFAQGQLMEPLIKDTEYVVSFYISLAEKSQYGIKYIGVLFSENELNTANSKSLLKYKKTESRVINFTEIGNPKYFADKEEWMFISFRTKARGGERFLTIGNFRNNQSTVKNTTNGIKSAGYYYLDMVSIKPVMNDPFDRDFLLDTNYVLNDVLFKTDEYSLDGKAKKSLQILADRLKKNPSLHLTVHTHTDTDGSDQYNKSLSTKRALAITEYLVLLGAAKERLKFIGHGGEKPIADNSQPEGKEKNRRAEFELSKGKFKELNNNTGFAETIFEDEQ